MSRGFVCIITNVASKWGKTPVNYTQFAAMHTTYTEKGLRIIGFPCNQFGKQVRSILYANASLTLILSNEDVFNTLYQKYCT